MYRSLFCENTWNMVLWPFLIRDKKKWIITPRFTHFFGFHPPCTNKSKNNSDFIFVGPRPPTDNLSPTKMDIIFVGFPSQQKWKKIWRPSQVSVLIHCTVLKYWYNSTVSLTMILYISGSSIRTVISQCQDLHSRFYLCLRPCMHFILHSFVVRCVFAHHGKRWDLRCHHDNCRDSSTVDSGQ